MPLSSSLTSHAVAFATLALLLGCAEAMPSHAPAMGPLQTCPADHTPVVDKNWNPLGCNKAPRNRVKPGSSCKRFKRGALTTDATGGMYECRD